jgi:hypothetical protein
MLTKIEREPDVDDYQFLALDLKLQDQQRVAAVSHQGQPTSSLGQLASVSLF